MGGSIGGIATNTNTNTHTVRQQVQVFDPHTLSQFGSRLQSDLNSWHASTPTVYSNLHNTHWLKIGYALLFDSAFTPVSLDKHKKIFRLSAMFFVKESAR